jgi:hypothetical protein
MSNTRVYSGYGVPAFGSIGAGQEAAEAGNAEPTVAECGHTVDQSGDVVLAGSAGEAYGDAVGAKVPNLSIEHVRTPVTTRTLPADVATNQNPLTAGSRGRRGK